MMMRSRCISRQARRCLLRSNAAVQRVCSFSSASASPAPPTVISSEDSNFRMLTLNREKALNAANLPLIRELSHYFDIYEPNAKIHAIVLRGAGHRAFCAGGDVKALWENGQNDETRNEAFSFFAEECVVCKRALSVFLSVVTVVVVSCNCRRHRWMLWLSRQRVCLSD